MAGTFFKDQALALQCAGNRIDVAFVEHRSLRQMCLRDFRESYFQVTETHEDGLFVLRQKGWNTILQTVPGALIWVRLTERLVDSYVKKYGKPHILHAHNALWGGYAASLIARRLGIPYLITEHSSAFLMGELSARLAGYVTCAYAGASHVIAVSRNLAQAVNAHMGGRQATVIPNVVDTEFFTPPSIVPAKIPFRFLSVGNLVDVKGFDVLIRAFATQSKGSTDELHIVGQGTQRPMLEALVDALGIRSRVYFAGQLSREEVREKMRTSHALVLPSLRETFGVVLIEAMSIGLPVIATRSGGPDDIVTPDVGLLVEAGNSTLLSAALVQMRQSRHFNSGTIRNHAVNHFNRCEFNRRYDAIFAEILRRGSSTSPSSQGGIS